MFADHILAYFERELNFIDTNYLEIGVFLGESIEQLSRKFPNKIIVGIDPFIEDGWTSHTSKVKAGERLLTQKENTYSLIKNKTNIKFFEMTSKEFSDKLTDQMILDLNVGAVFIDGDHHYDNVVNDYHLSMKLVGPKKGIIVWDDVTVPDVVKALKEFETIYKDRISEKIDLGRTSLSFKIKESL